MNSITELMINDHERIIDLLNQFKRNKNTRFSDSKKLFAQFRKELEKHFNTESRITNIAFSSNKKLKKSNILPISNSLELDHIKIMQIVQEIQTSIKKNEKNIDISDLYLNLTRHKNIEERLFYPKLDGLLTEKEKIYINEKINR